MATPLEIEIAIWYVTRGASAGDFGRLEGRKDAPAVQDALSRFALEGLLIHHPGETRDYSATDGLKLYLAELERVAFPIQVWTMPSAHQ